MTPLKKILIPIDFSEDSLRVIDQLKAIGLPKDAKILLLHVLPENPLVEPILEMYQKGDSVEWSREEEAKQSLKAIAAERMAKAKERWGGYEFEYWEVSGRGHDLPPGGMDALLAKIEARERDARPKKIVWQPVLEWKQQFYWLWWDRPTVGAVLEAEIDAASNTVRIACDGALEGIEVLLDERVVDLARPVAIQLDGTEVYRGQPAPSLAVLARTALAGDEGLVFAYGVRVARP